MDGKSRVPHNAQEDELNNALELDNVDDIDGLTIRNQRQAKIQEYEESALTRLDPLAAVIGIGNADFQRIFESLGVAILDQIEAGSKSLDELRELGPDIRLLLKIRKAIETDIALHSLEAEQEPSAVPRRLNATELQTKTDPYFKRSLPRR